ncbi:hypothetical protein HORIV_58420 [Vreelandella olivaria]|uniref:Signal peptidase II n=1 Tax=Vreelandella olivaria TaxID=390919 RepID=A0ABN5X2W4_9GAMM|nr:hypothetical protein HORIV_58420 [Halomonas olivaria]
MATHPGWQRWFFALIAVGASVALTMWLSRIKNDEKLLAIALPLIIGGALGNLYDRLVHGYVVDFYRFTLPVGTTQRLTWQILRLPWARSR